MNDESRLKADTVKAQGVYVSTPQGNSMRPMLRGERDQIAVVALTEKARRGDVLLFENAERQVLHRVVRVTDTGYLTRGDNCYVTETVPFDAVIGKLSVFWRNGREIDCEKNVLYRFYGFFWRVGFPLRHFTVRVKRKLSRLFRRCR